MIACAGCGAGCGAYEARSRAFACCGRSWCRTCYEPHLHEHVAATARKREGLGLRNLDLRELESEMASARRRRELPSWHPRVVPTAWLLGAILAAAVLGAWWVGR